MKFKITTKPEEIDKKKWGEFVFNHPNGNIFQTPEMFKFYDSIPNYCPLVFIVTDVEGNYKALCVAVIQSERGIIGYFSSRAIIFGGPVIDDSEKEAGKYLEILLKILNKQLKKKAIYTEFRNLNDYEKYKKNFLKFGYEYKQHLNFHVDCTDEDEIMKRMSSSRRRQVRKSLREGAEIIVAEREEEVLKFYKILKNLYKEKVKKPLPPKEYFINFFNNPDLGKYLLIKYKGKIIGGIMCPIFDNCVIYEGYIAGEDGKYKGIYPSVLATWAAIDYAAKNGIKYFDFMGAGNPNEDYGVREFKSKFGGELVNFGRFEKIHKPFLYKIAKIGFKFWQKFK